MAIINRQPSIDKLHILHLINVRWYNACAYYALALAAAQKGLGHKVFLAGDPNNPYISKAESMNLDFDKSPRLSSYFPHLVGNISWLKKFIKNKGIEVVVAHRGEAHVVAALAKKIHRLDFALIRVRGDVRPPKSDLFNRFLYSGITDGVICTTAKLREIYLSLFKLSPRKVVVIPAGIDTGYYSRKRADIEQLKEEYSIPTGKKIITMLGRWSPIKGHKYFIKMAGRIIPKYTNLLFLIAGEQFEITKTDLRDMIDRYAPNAEFKIIGLVDDVRDILHLTDIAVIPSLGSEMIARVALEFMAAGKPIIASRVNALAETVDDGAGGFLVSPGDFNGLAEALIRLLENENEIKEFGGYNKSLAENKFSLEKWASDSISFYLSLL